MGKLEEHFEQLAREDEVAQQAQREAADRIAAAEQHALLNRCDRLLASEDVAWFLAEMQKLVDAETDAALSLRHDAETARQHAQRRDIGLTMVGWIARMRARVASELQAAAK